MPLNKNDKQKLPTQRIFYMYKRLMRAVKPYWFIFVLGILATLASSAIDGGIAWGIKPLLDKGLVAREHQFLHTLPIWILMIFIFRGLANFLSDYYVTKVGRSVVMDFRQKIFTHMLKLPASFFDRKPSGELLSLIIYNVEQLAAATTDALLTIISEGSLVIALIVVMFAISWKLTLLFVIAAPLALGVMHYTTKRLRKISFNVQQSVAEVSHIASECIDGYRVVRTFGGEDYENAKFAKATKTNRQRELKSIVTNSLGSSVVQVIAAIPIAIIIYIATLPSLIITVGGFGAIIAAILRILTPLKRLTKVNTIIQRGIASVFGIFDLLDMPPEEDTGTKTLERAKGKIEYRNVSFHYPNFDRKVLDNVSFTAHPGQVIALVGHSGGGKSTLVSLLPRFYDLASGEILLDDVNIKDYRLFDLRKQFALVSQHVILFNDTIAHNIAYGRFANATKEEIINAAKAAYIWDFIHELPDGLNTVIGEHGLLLSGGQRQRIAIARAILKDAPVLILDEATSSLDTEAERYLQGALEQLMRNRTTLVIAHRLSTIENADMILVLDGGRIVEHGTHSELLKLKGYYAKLHKMQFHDE
jgi:subfamily B ATP-binding cassette protein MsbA